MRLYETAQQKLDISSLLTPAVRKLDQAMKRKGFSVRIVGGAVRDLVLEKDPKDIDMATDATPDEMIKVFDEAGIRYEPTGLQHGTLTVILDGEPIEITTLRIDKETDGRHADVEFTRDWKIDAERRDLTFNAMSVDLDGTLYDYFNGVRDLKAGNAKFVGDAGQRMDEDFLRILRYFRFQGRMPKPNWELKTLSTIKEKAKGLTQISGERVWMEMSKIISGDHAPELIKKMAETGVAEHINLPTGRVSDLQRVRKYSKDPVIGLAALMDDLFDVEEVKALWKFSSEVFLAVKYIVNNRDTDLDETTVKILVSRPKVNRDHVAKLALYLGQPHLAKLGMWFSPEAFPVTGKDLQDAGMLPGPDMGRVLTDMRAKWEASGFALTQQQLLDTLR
jgi:tRNA nucleotidyltransferase (CCA-adding enzyme)